MSYLAGLEVSKTQYVLHYDSDMLLHQSPGYDWSVEAKERMETMPAVVASTPRISPPFSKQVGIPDAPSRHEGRPFTLAEGGWYNDWFSTRCFLMDREKLKQYLPLLQGSLVIEALVTRLLKRGFPRSPEIMLFKRVGRGGGLTLNMSTENAWLLHPATKPESYLQLLPKIQESVKEGQIPFEQRGHSNIDIEAWKSFVG